MFIQVFNKDDANLLEKRMRDKNICVVLYYMNGCFFCENMKSEWEKFESKYIKDKYCTVSKIEASNIDLLSKRPDISGYPTICKYINGKREDFNGERTEKALTKFVKDSIKSKKKSVKSKKKKVTKKTSRKNKPPKKVKKKSTKK